MSEFNFSLPSIHDADAVNLFRRKHRLRPDQIRRMRYGMYRLVEPIDMALGRLGDPAKEAAYSELELSCLEVAQEHVSQLDQSNKLVLKTRDGHRFETVLMKAHTGRTTVCVSTQVGCQAGCSFCATARMRLTRNLNYLEIIEQVLLAARRAKQQGRRLRNVVFMGMGEPLHNEEEVYKALELLSHPQYFGFSARRLTVSTVGVPAAMRRLADRFPSVQLALSLHAARPEVRARLIPHTRTHDWDELHQTLIEIATRPPAYRRQVVMIEYLLINGVNDQLEDAEALIEYLRGLPVIVNLIPFNAIPFAPQWQPTPREQRSEFANVLRKAGLFTTIRYSMGSDVQAACGQLVQSTAPAEAQRI